MNGLAQAPKQTGAWYVVTPLRHSSPSRGSTGSLTAGWRRKWRQWLSCAAANSRTTVSAPHVRSRAI